MAYRNFKKTEIIEEIGSELRKTRLSNEQTLSQVADIMDTKGFHLSTTMLGRIETGERRIDDTLLNALCEHYNVNSNELITRACQSHVTELNEDSDLPKLNLLSESKDVELLVKQYLSLPADKQAEVRTMMRMLLYMDKFKNLDI